jgi:hypothetical protein
MDEITSDLMLFAVCVALFILFCGGLLLSSYRQTTEHPRKNSALNEIPRKHDSFLNT